MDQLSNDHFIPEQAGVHGNRAGVRDSLLLSAQLGVGDQPPVHVRVRNLSPGGLIAEYAAPASTGMPVRIEVRGIGWVSGRIAWATDGRIGIAFDAPIDPLLARKPVGKGTQTPTFTKPILPLR